MSDYLARPYQMSPAYQQHATIGYEIRLFDSGGYRTFKSNDLDSIVYTLMLEILSLNDGMRRVGALRDLCDEHLRRRGLEMLGIAVRADSAVDTPKTQAISRLKDFINEFRYDESYAGAVFRQRTWEVVQILEAAEC